MTQEDLLRENEQLNARLAKATSVFKEQKTTIERLTEERDSALEKTKNANEQDQLFFDQQQEIEELKTKLTSIEKDFDSLKDEKEKLSERLTKASEEYTKLKDKFTTISKSLQENQDKFNKILEILK